MIMCDTYREACILLRLTEKDDYWDSSLEEAAATRHPRKLKNLFAVMIATCEISNPKGF